MHDLRRTLYHHIHRLSLAEHDEKRTGDLIGRVTSDIDSIQDFVTSALLGIVTSVLTLLGIIGVMLYMNWRFTVISLSIAPFLFLVVYFFTRRIKKASRDVRKKESELVSTVEEVFSSIRWSRPSPARITRNADSSAKASTMSRRPCSREASR